MCELAIAHYLNLCKSDGELNLLAMSRALHVLSFCVLGLAPPAVDLLEALGRCVCTRRSCSHLLLPLSFFLGVVASSHSLAGFMFKVAQHGSLSSHRHGSLFFGGLCVRDGLTAYVCVCRTSATSVEPLPRGWRAVAFPRRLHVLSCSTWLIVRCCIGGLCFGLIGADNIYTCNAITRSLSRWHSRSSAWIGSISNASTTRGRCSADGIHTNTIGANEAKIQKLTQQQTMSHVEQRRT